MCLDDVTCSCEIPCQDFTKPISAYILQHAFIQNAEPRFNKCLCKRLKDKNQIHVHKHGTIMIMCKRRL